MNGPYKIIGRYTEGVKVIGYALQNADTGEVGVINKQIVEQLALSKAIMNCSGQFYDDKVVLKGINCKLVNLPNCTADGRIVSKEKELISNKQEPLYINARIVDGKNIVGYRLFRLNDNGDKVEKNIERDKVLQLARSGLIANARVQRSNDKLLLRGVKCDLAQLPMMRLSEQVASK